jgi:hypothetical protein
MFKFQHCLNLLIIMLFVSCTQITSLGFKKHEFGQQPTKIVWLQVAGLSEEHFSLLKFAYQNSDVKTEVENYTCLGKAWNYNLYNLRTSSDAGFRSQTVGSKNIKNKCSDFQKNPIWAYLLKSRYHAGFFESGATAKQSLNQVESCNPKEQQYLKNVTHWISSPYIKRKISAKKFHSNDVSSFEKNQKYFDSSCNKGSCFTSLSENVISVFERFKKNKEYYIFTMRDFSYEKTLQKGDFTKVKSILLELNKLLNYFRTSTEHSNTLVLLSTSSPIGIEFPAAGKNWRVFENKGRGALLKRRKLMSSVLATGARAENFCGHYEESEILERVLSGPKQQGLEFKIFNPFSI